MNFTKIAIVILNQKVRPFIAKWHLLSEQDAFERLDRCQEFRNELELLRKDLASYARLLAEMANVEDLTHLELA